MDIVESVLEQTAKEASKYKPITVQKHLNLEYDLGLLMAYDPNDLEYHILKTEEKEEYLQSLSRDNFQLMINKIWQLPIKEEDELVKVQLPKSRLRLPREKPVPKLKTLTRWEEFARRKGITKKKKGVTWDETLEKWIPSYGYQKAKADKDKNWLVEVEDNQDPFVDPFAKQNVDKKEAVAKNEFQRLKNIARAKGVNMPNTGVMQPETPTELQIAQTVAKASTASLGKFQKKLNNKETPAKDVGDIVPGQKVNKWTNYGDSVTESSNNLRIINKVLGKGPEMNFEKAVNKQMHMNQAKRAAERLIVEGESKRKRKEQKPKGAKRPKGGKGIKKRGKNEPRGRKRR